MELYADLKKYVIGKKNKKIAKHKIMSRKKKRALTTIIVRLKNFKANIKKIKKAKRKNKEQKKEPIDFSFTELLSLMKSKFVRGHELDRALIVNLTSYPARFEKLHVTLLSLLNQSVLPDKIILWIYSEDYKELPERVRTLQRRGLEIRQVISDIKQFKKLIPALSAFPNDYLVTADDDIFYKPTWLEELVCAYKKIGGIVAQRAHVLQFSEQGQIQPYNDWIKNMPKGSCVINSPFVMPTTGGGVLYPPDSFDVRAKNIKLAMALCPYADDIWFYFMHLLHGKTASRIGTVKILSTNADKSDALWSINVKQNDAQLVTMFKHFSVPELLKKNIIRITQILKSDKIIKLASGHCLQVLNDHIGNIVCNTQDFYESDLINYVKRYFSPRVVIDVGANIGNHAVGFSGIEGYEVYCFEPDVQLAQIAKKNLQLNAINGHVFAVGVGEKEGFLPFFSAPTANQGLGYFTDNLSADTKKLKVKPLDILVEQKIVPDLIKIDTEGFEIKVLKGAHALLERSVPVLIIGLHNFKSFLNCMKYLNLYNYKPLRVFGATPTFVFIPNERFGFCEVGKDFKWVEDFFKGDA